MTATFSLETLAPNPDTPLMPKTALKELVQYCDRTLRTAEVNDYEGAVNGLQVENLGTVTRIAASVDASLSTIKLAIAARADLLIVHHGLFWGPRHPWTGRNHEILRLLIDHNLAIYSSHLPLDLHPTLGNNSRLCSALGLRRCRPFFFDRNQHLGLQSCARLSLKDVTQRLEDAVGVKPIVVPGGPAVCRRIGVVTGGAGSEVKRAAREGVDTFITGEGPHWSHALAEELGINVLYGGHYATETFGVKALAENLSKKFKLPWQFLDHPTGL